MEIQIKAQIKNLNMKTTTSEMKKWTGEVKLQIGPSEENSELVDITIKTVQN